MNSIVNKSGETIAFLLQNMILDISQEKVIGLILGNCVFGSQNIPTGKLFNNTFHKKNGRIIARLGKYVSLGLKKLPEGSNLLLQAWQILKRVNNHDCSWIDEKKSWTKQNFLEYLSVEKELVEVD